MDKVILDAMGGDNAPYATVAGAVKALKDDKNLYIILAGRENDIKAELAKYEYDSARVEISNFDDVIGMNDGAAESVKRKDSSMMGSYWRIKKEEDICAFVTAGSTGSTIVGGQLILGRLRGVKRPALCPALPNSRGGVTLLIDCGANAECKSSMLCQFAYLGSAYATVGFGIKEPKVGLLNNGTEEHKGDPLRQETYKMLSEMKGINFIGNVEGRDILLGDCDVVVSDGFSGNIALKSIEGCAKLVLQILKTEFKRSLRSKIGYLFMKKGVKNMRAQLDFDKVGGALLVGLRKPVLKAHGSAKPETIENAIKSVLAIHRGKLVPAIEEKLAGVDFGERDEL